jgi:hypothetical protein
MAGMRVDKRASETRGTTSAVQQLPPSSLVPGRPHHRHHHATSRVIGPRRSIDPNEWQTRFADAAKRIRAGTPTDLTPDEVEAEITAARDEVRRERAARRQAVRG